MLIPVILSGGSGTRLWPLSRELYPKQFLPLVGTHSLLQETLLRLTGLAETDPIVVCNEEHRFIVAEQLRQVGRRARAIVLEPIGRNTAPAVALAALTALAREEGPEPLLLVLPADHVIRDVPAFHAAVKAGLESARAGGLVTFGVVPSAPEVGYGYIRKGPGTGPDYPVARFVEKPDATRAREYLASNEYLWNSGMFLLDARRYLEMLKEYAPDIEAACRTSFAAARADLDFTRVGGEAFTGCRSDSIDYAVMEKTTHARVVPLDAGWSDVGSWSALYDASQADADRNVTHGDVLAEATRGCYLYSGDRLVATLGVEDLVVVDTKDAVLVAHRSRVQDVKALVARLKAAGRSEVANQREVFRPWGSYDSVDAGDRFQVKRLTVKPGATLSLQMHHHRAEHWVVVSGTARITCDERVFLLAENESTFIPIGAKHRIENPGKVPLHIIEVQSGTYLGEDDIVRFADDYGRKS